MLGRYARLGTVEETDEEDPLAVQLRPLTWKEQLSASPRETFVTRALLALAPILPNHALSFSMLRKIIFLFFVLSTLLFVSSQTWLSHVRFLPVSVPLACPSPFRSPGHLHVNSTHTSDNYWVPDDNLPNITLASSCPKEPPDFMEAFQAYMALSSSSSHLIPSRLRFLIDRTVVLFGDFLDRDHLDHFCTFVGATPRILHPSDPLYPDVLRVMEHSLAAEERQGQEFGTDQSRPLLCEVQRLNFVLLWVFYMGSDDGWTTPGLPEYRGERLQSHGSTSPGWGPTAFWPSNTEHFHPPLRPEQRIDELILPLLRNLGRTADLVEIGIGAWDLDMFKRLDESAVQHYVELHPDEAYQENALSNSLISTSLSSDRANWLALRLQELLQHSFAALPPKAAIYVRPLQVIPQYYEWPYLLAADRIKVLHNIVRQEIYQPKLQGSWWSSPRRVNRVKEDTIGLIVAGNADEADPIHPAALPGSWLWSQWLLWELQQSLAGS